MLVILIGLNDAKKIVIAIIAHSKRDVSTNIQSIASKMLNLVSVSVVAKKPQTNL